MKEKALSISMKSASKRWGKDAAIGEWKVYKVKNMKAWSIETGDVKNISIKSASKRWGVDVASGAWEKGVQWEISPGITDRR